MIALWAHKRNRSSLLFTKSLTKARAGLDHWLSVPCNCTPETYALASFIWLVVPTASFAISFKTWTALQTDWEARSLTQAAVLLIPMLMLLLCIDLEKGSNAVWMRAWCGNEKFWSEYHACRSLLSNSQGRQRYWSSVYRTWAYGLYRRTFSGLQLGAQSICKLVATHFHSTANRGHRKSRRNRNSLPKMAMALIHNFTIARDNINLLDLVFRVLLTVPILCCTIILVSGDHSCHVLTNARGTCALVNHTQVVW